MAALLSKLHRGFIAASSPLSPSVPPFLSVHYSNYSCGFIAAFLSQRKGGDIKKYKVVNSLELNGEPNKGTT
jgi:hypothetical protein